MNIQDGEKRRNPQLLKLDGSLTSVYGATAEYPPPPHTHTHLHKMRAAENIYLSKVKLETAKKQFCYLLPSSAVICNRRFHGFRRHFVQSAKWLKMREFVWKFGVKYL